MESVAIDLKLEREKKKLPLVQIAADTRISLRYLQSIEEGRFSDLPGGVYNRAFLKAYCESINIDPREVLERYDAQVLASAPEKSQQPVITIPNQKSFFIPVPIVIWGIMLLISAIGIFFSRGWISELFSPYFSEKPVADIQYQLPTESPANAESSTTDKPDVGGSESPVKTGTSPGVEVIAEKSLPAVPENPATAELEAGRFETLLATKLRMEIVAKDPCWISVDVDGQPSSRRLMEPGEELVFNAAGRLFILIGNAGGVQMKLNGESTKPLGNPGEVIKMNIDLENLQQFLDKSAG